MDKIINKLQNIGIDFGIKIVVFILILLIGFKISNVIIKLINKGKGFNKLENSVKTFISSFLNILFKILILITGFTYLGVPMTSITAIFTSASLAIGLALQGGLTNMIGGLLILIFKPFKVGDFIKNGDNSGTVEAITIFYTIIRTYTNEKIVLPNGALANSDVTNYSGYPKRKLEIHFSVSYKADVDKVKKVLKEVIDKEEYVLKDEEIFIRMTKHDDSAIIYTTRVWCKTEDYWNLKFDMLEDVKRAFDKNGIEIPYPQMDVHLERQN